MLDRNEIEKRLEGVDPQLCVAFAARCSLRVLPLLVLDEYKEAFWYWNKTGPSKYILALFTAQQVSINISISAKKINESTVAIANYADDATTAASYAAHAVNVAKATSSAAKAAFSVIANDNISTVVFASYAATYASVAIITAADRVNINIESEILLDLDKITNSATSFSLTDFILSSLWSESNFREWLPLCVRFNQSLIALNKGFDLWGEWYRDRFFSVMLDKKQEEKWLAIPAEVREQGVKATNAYLATLSTPDQKYTLKPLNLVRAIFIGNGASGKTSLIHKLYKEPVVEGKEEMTPGIEIREWSIPKTKIKAKIWDFGGQVMSHSTHQFFLRERSLYILVLDARAEFNANDQAEYWLEHIKAFGNNASVMLVGNKSDLTAVNLDMNALREKYPNIVDFYPVSCTSEALGFTHRYDVFHDDLVEQLKTIGTHQVMFTNNQFEVLEQVRKLSRKDAFLDYDKFDSLCKQYEIGKVGLDQQSFLGLLDSLGEIIHFPDLDWAEAYVLNPRWLTHGVYTLLYDDKTTQQQGELSEADVVEILHLQVIEDEQGNKLTYPKTKCRFIIDAMSNFKLSYRLLEDSSRFIIPDKLPTEQPDLSDYFDKNAEGTLAFEFDFQGLLPRNIMPNLIVARHKEIVKNNKRKQLVWQHGVITYNSNCKATARLQVDYHQRILQLWIQGKEPREYLVILRDEIYKILDVIKGLLVKENVILPDSARVNNIRGFLGKGKFERGDMEKAPYERLLKEAKRRQKVTSSDSGVDYYLDEVMGFIMTKEQQKKETAKIENHFHGDAHIAAQSAGDHNDVSGKIKITLDSSNKQDIVELQDSLTALMSHLDKRELDILVKVNALAELQEINMHLGNIENITPESKGRVLQLLTNIKDGTLGAIKLGNEIKESSEIVAWVMEKAVVVSAFLAVSPM